MRHKLISLALGASLVFGLGCAGVGEALMEMTGSEMKMGDDAEHPADFPLSAPPEGKIQANMSMGLGGMKTVTVVYELESGTDTDALLKSYEDELTAGGGTITEQKQDATTSLVVQQEGGGMLSVSLTKQGDKSILTLLSASKDE